MKRTITLFTAVLISCIDAISCDCGRGIISVNIFNSNDWIFIGTLIKEERFNTFPHRKCTYKVVTAYKGVKQGDTVEIHDAENVGACGLGRLTIGGDYLMYARGETLKFTSSCQENSRVPILILPRDSIAIKNIQTGRWRGAIDDTTNTIFHGDTLFLSAHILKVPNNALQKFYDKNGKLSAEGRYKNGVPVGLWRYYEHGKLVEYGKYSKGKKDSLWARQHGTSKYIEEFIDGEYSHKEITFFDGKIYSKKEPVANGKKWISSVFHDNGKPRFIAYANPPERNDKGRLKEPVWDGPFKTFNKAGIVLDEGLHENGFSVGHWKYYYEDGKLRMEGDYIEGKKSGLWKIYHSNKKIKAIGLYEKDEKIGEWKHYDINGKEIPPNPDYIKEDEDWFTYSGVKK
ncbi:MAG: toxin-antitoxin system YwqK family antitoxin [Taibaiella sp.]|nr:toxin-antitoxin system YwqK family antitoxin [Taibaiella sp.]